MLQLALLGVLAVAASAQEESKARVAADGLPLIVDGGSGWSAMRAFSSGFTADDRGRLWVLAMHHAAAADGRGDWRQLSLHRSDDGGQSWRHVADAPGPWNDWGAAVGDPRAPILHLAWSTRLPGSQFSSAVYQRFDTEQGRWLGEPEVLQQGAGAEDQFGVNDLAVTADDTVVVFVATHRNPKQPPWPSGWSSGLMMRGPNDTGWRGPFAVNTSSFAVWGNLQLHEGRAHTTFRSSPSHSIIGYRSFALGGEEFDQPAPVEISVRPDSGRFVSNASSLLIGPFGGRTVVYPAGNSATDGKGQLLVAHAEYGQQWRTEVLVDDPPLAHGNVPHEHFALVRGPGRQAIALYSKIAEHHRVLYQRVIDGGQPMGPERVLARSDVDGAYWRIVGQRDARLETGMLAVVSGRGDGERLGVRAVRSPRDPRTRWQ